MKKIITLILFFFYFQSSIFALHTFIGTVDDQWDNAANWDMGTLPTSSDDVVINSSCLVSTVVVPLGYTVIIADLLIEDGKELSIMIESSLTTSTINLEQGTITNDGYLLVRILEIGTLVVGDIGIINNNGTLELNNGAPATILITRGTFNNNQSLNGTAFSGNAIFLELLADGIFNNHGDFNKSGSTGEIIRNKGVINNEVGANFNLAIQQYSSYPGASILNYSGGVFTNKGNISLSKLTPILIPIGIVNQGLNTFVNEATGTIFIVGIKNDPIQIAGNSDFINKGSIYIEKGFFGGGNMIVGNSPTSIFTNTSTGTLSGDGKIFIDNFDFEGTLSPGSSPGKVTVDTDFNFNNVTYLAELEGTSGAGVAGGNDLIEITGTADLANGTLDVTFLGGFSPSNGDEFILLTGTTVSNTFSTVNLPALPFALIWDLTYNATSVVLKVVANPLPVELISFRAYEKSEKHELIWSTATETNTSHFEIEYSLDGTDWKKVGSVAALGESNSVQNYSFENTWDRFTNHHYYRLKIIDLDYSFEYSDIQSIRSTPFAEVKIFPNPFSNSIQIKVPDAKFEILNAQNQVVYQSNNSNENIDLSHLPIGIYLIKYQADGKPMIHKIIKSNK